jgi:acyl carrier protein
MPTPTENAIRDFLLSELHYDRSLPDLPVDQNLIENGLIDSLALLRVVAFCEERFGVVIPDAEVVPDNMESVAAIARLVEKVRAAQAR